MLYIYIYHFSNTFERVQADSEKWWYYHLYTVVTDYAKRIPSPINLILRPPQFVLYVLKRNGKLTFVIMAHKCMKVVWRRVFFKDRYKSTHFFSVLLLQSKLNEYIQNS